MTEVHHGLEGVIAFETEIAEPDKEGSALRYRGVDIEEIVGRIPFEKVWGLLIDGSYDPGLPPAEPYNLPIHPTGSFSGCCHGAFLRCSGCARSGLPDRPSR